MGSLYTHLYLSIYLSAYLSICLSVYLSICLSIHLSIYIHICIYIYICISLSLSRGLSRLSAALQAIAGANIHVYEGSYHFGTTCCACGFLETLISVLGLYTPSLIFRIPIWDLHHMRARDYEVSFSVLLRLLLTPRFLISRTRGVRKQTIKTAFGAIVSAATQKCLGSSCLEDCSMTSGLPHFSTSKYAGFLQAAS